MCVCCVCVCQCGLFVCCSLLFSFDGSDSEQIGAWGKHFVEKGVKDFIVNSVPRGYYVHTQAFMIMSA